MKPNKKSKMNTIFRSVGLEVVLQKDGVEVDTCGSISADDVKYPPVLTDWYTVALSRAFSSSVIEGNRVS